MTRVVLLGGGYVTLHAYRGLVRRLGDRVRRGEVEVVVVSADDCHSFHGFTGEVLAGILPFERTRTPLTEACPLATVVHARVTHVDPAGRVVTFQPVAGGAAETLGYDELVVGTGGREPAHTVPGLAEHGHTLRGPGEIEALACHLRHLVSASTYADTRPTVVVAGGGVAGTEVAAAAADLARGQLDVLLVHSGDRLLPDLRRTYPRLADRAELELERLGVRTLLHTRLLEVTGDGAVLRSASGDLTEVAGTVVGTIGQRAARLPGLEDLRQDDQGRLRTNSSLMVAPHVWAAGDAARVLHPSTGEPVATNALWAIKAGAHVGRNLARTLLERPTEAFGYRGLGQAASYGLGRSVVDLYGVELTGATAWVARMAFFLRFMPSRRRAAAVVGDLGGLLLEGVGVGAGGGHLHPATQAAGPALTAPR